MMSMNSYCYQRIWPISHLSSFRPLFITREHSQAILTEACVHRKVLVTLIVIIINIPKEFLFREREGREGERGRERERQRQRQSQRQRQRDRDRKTQREGERSICITEKIKEVGLNIS